MPERTPVAWLVLGGIHLINGTAAPSAQERLVLIAVPRAEPVLPANTVVLTWDRLGDCPATVVRIRDGAVLARTDVQGARLFPHATADPALRELAGVDGSLVPLCYLSTDPDGGYHVYGQIRFLAQDGCFIRITSRPVGAGAVEQLAWLAPGLAAHAEHSLFLNNHQRYYQKCFPGRELEYKYTFDPAPDIWALTVELNRRIHAGDLTGFLPEYRDEFQAWDYANHLFEVTGPPDERGYVSFIPTTDGRRLMKRKWYVEDGLSRREQHTYGLDIPTVEYPRYIREVLGVQARQLPPFRRVRYDVNFESVRTGHVFGIFFDHCSLYDAPDVVLSQCELEYLRTRSPLPLDEKSALTELEALAGWLEGYLAEHGLSTGRTFYSKRTFLTDAVARRPDLLRPATGS